jgi:hypothetical protein
MRSCASKLYASPYKLQLDDVQPQSRISIVSSIKFASFQFSFGHPAGNQSLSRESAALDLLIRIILAPSRTSAHGCAKILDLDISNQLPLYTSF